MKSLPWKAAGARLHLPRDLEVTYAVGRMGAATIYDVWPLFWTSMNTARTGIRRLVKLGLLRSFDRADPSHPAWYSLTERGATWVVAETGCDEGELRSVTGISRANLAALRVRNRFWTSLVIACRKTQHVRVELFRPEWELRQLKGPGVSIVPDAMIVLADHGTDGTAGDHGWAWMIEYDAGTERLSVWEAKGRAYAEARRRGSLYGASRWNVLALAPSVRRARGIAKAVSNTGAAAFVFVGIVDALEDGRALEPSLWRASIFARAECAPATESLVTGEQITLSNPDQRSRSTVDWGSCEETRAVP